MKWGWLCLVLVLGLAVVMPAQAEELDALLATYQAEAELQFSAQRGEALWYREQDGRSCLSCHGDSLRVPGRHQKTGKVIEAMAPSVNPDRLTEAKKIKKWLLRNCKWTFGRICTAQEKGDVLVWLKDQ